MPQVERGQLSYLVVWMEENIGCGLQVYQMYCGILPSFCFTNQSQVGCVWSSATTLCL